MILVSSIYTVVLMVDYQQLRNAFFVATAVSALLSCAPLPAQDCADYHRAEYKSIRAAREFSVTILGDPEHTPQEQFELRCILKREDRQEILQVLFREATPAGQMFALTGLILVSPVDARRAGNELRQSDPLVSYSSGDIVRQEKVSTLIDHLERGLAWRVIEPRKDVPAELSSFEF